MIDAGQPVPHNWVEWLIEFYPDPRVTYETERECAEHLLHVRSKNFHHRDHYCKFEMERVADGSYAIFCVDHPADGVRQ